MKKTLLLAGVAGLFAFNANAMELRPYVGLDYNYSDAAIAHHDQAWGYHGTFNAQENNYDSATVVVGTKFNTNFGIEGFFQQSQNETRQFYGKNTSRIQSYGIDALGYIPLGCEQKFELVGGLGVGSYELKTRAANTDGEDYIERRDKDEGIGYRISAGLQYNVTDNVALRGMYRHVIVNGSDLDRINEFSAGVRYTF